MTSQKATLDSTAYTFVIRILLLSLTSVSIFSVCCCSRHISLWQPTQSQQLLLFKYWVVIQFYFLFQAPHPCLPSPPRSQPARRLNPHRISGQLIKLVLNKLPYLMHQACCKKRGKALIKHRSVYIFLAS